MEDENSLYHEIRRLIQLRQTHEALQSNGGIEFLYAKKDAYPLVYIRSGKEEKILVILNPSEQEQSFPCRYSLGTEVYRINGRATGRDGEIVVSGKTAVMYTILD